jgi:CRISPR-associated protein Cmr2
MPLSDALNLARRAESTAKGVQGKNALAVAVSKRSGSETIVADTREHIYRRLTFFRYLHQSDEIPDGAAYELRDLANRLDVPKQDPNYATLQEAMEKETLRILKRKKGAKGLQPIDEEILKKLMHLSSSSQLRKFADEMIIARLFAQARVLADIPLYTPKELIECLHP